MAYEVKPMYEIDAVLTMYLVSTGKHYRYIKKILKHIDKSYVSAAKKIYNHRCEKGEIRVRKLDYTRKDLVTEYIRKYNIDSALMQEICTFWVSNSEEEFNMQLQEQIRSV